MKEIDHDLLERVLDNKDNKAIICTDCTELMAEYTNVIEKLKCFIEKKFFKYELAQWIKAKDFYILNKDTKNYYHYSARSIIYIELGNNVGGELSYEHLAVLIKDGGEKLYVVPCSSSNRARYKLKSYDKEYMLATEANGFPRETVLFLREARWISKARVVSIYKSRVEPEFFNDIYTRLLRDVYKSKQDEMESAYKTIETYRINEEKYAQEMLSSRKEIVQLKEEIEKIKKDNDDLYEMLEIKMSELKISKKG